jgi:hypothetical protein
MFSQHAAKRNLKVTQLKGTLDDAIRYNVPFLVATKFSDASGAYCIAVTSAGNDSVTTSPAFFGDRALSKHDLNSISSGIFYLVRKESGQNHDKSRPEQKTPSLSSAGSSK